MKLRTICLLLGAGLLAGCWQKSLHAFYTPGDVVSEPKIVGAWQQLDDNGKREDGKIWNFTEGVDKAYWLEYQDKEEKLRYEARVFKLDGERFLDIVSVGDSVSTIPAHHLFKVIEIGPRMQMAMFNLDWVRRHLRNNPASLAHITIIDPDHRDDRDRDEIVLTADTKSLQSFVRQHRKDPDFFTGPLKLEPAQSETRAKK